MQIMRMRYWSGSWGHALSDVLPNPDTAFKGLQGVAGIRAINGNYSGLLLLPDTIQSQVLSLHGDTGHVRMMAMKRQGPLTATMRTLCARTWKPKQQPA